MNIAYCGLDCEACEARLATVNNDNELRQRVAREWSELNGVEITAEMINWARAEKMERIVPLKELWKYPKTLQIRRRGTK